MAEPPPLRVGALGGAAIARRRMLPALRAGNGTELVAVASRVPDRAAALAAEFGGRAVPGYAELLELDEVEAVYVPLPVGLHAAWIERALLAGKHVLAEKPISTDPATTWALLSLARERGLTLMENAISGHHAQQAVVRALLADGVLGEPRILTATYTVPPPAPGDFRRSAGLGGGALLDAGYHPVRLALELLGPELDVLDATLDHAPLEEGGPPSPAATEQVDTGGSALLRSTGGTAVQVGFGWERRRHSGFEIWGSTGYLRVDQAFLPAADHRPRLLILGPDGPRELALGRDDPAAAAARAFAEAARNGGEDAAAARLCLREAELLDEIRLTATCPR